MALDLQIAPALRRAGVAIGGHGQTVLDLEKERILQHLGVADLSPIVCKEVAENGIGETIFLRVLDTLAEILAPGGSTLDLRRRLPFSQGNELDALRREVVLAMLLGPGTYQFPDIDEFLSAVNIRCNIASAARKTMLSFGTIHASRPEDCWIYDEDRGFLLRKGASLIDALKKATQPEVSGSMFSFSCYRATEYVILLGIAQELKSCNPGLYSQLESLWTRRSIKSGEFHNVFLREHGSMAEPLPDHYFVPGDRVWFRNPDPISADVTGYEGSWVIYLGNGLFSNFWKHSQSYTIIGKSLEIYHWRNAVIRNAQTIVGIDESKVALLVEASLNNTNELSRITLQMLRFREPQGTYTEAGGCLDTTREASRWVRSKTADLVLPAD